VDEQTASSEGADLALDTERAGNAATIRVSGELDAYTAPNLDELCRSLYEDGVRAVVVDFRATSFLDSSGLRALLSSHRRFADEGGSLRVVDPSEPVLRLLEITGLSEHFGVEPRSAEPSGESG